MPYLGVFTSVILSRPRHFMARIKNTLREGLEGLLATSEVFVNFTLAYLLESLTLTFSTFVFHKMYYRQKGQRTPTRPQAIHENFDLCAEALVQRLTSYKTQAEEYHNSCIQGEEEWE